MARLTLFAGLLVLVTSHGHARPPITLVRRTSAALNGSNASNNVSSSTLRVAGSSTVLPVASSWAAAVRSGYANIIVESGGSSSGARRVCHPDDHEDKVDIGAMSREWKPSEALRLDDGYTLQCINSGIRVTQVSAGVDGLAVIVGRGSAAHACVTNADLGGLTLAMLRWIFSDWTDAQLSADGVNLASVLRNDNRNGVKEWSDLHEACAQVPINIYGAGESSGTHDFFGDHILCKNCFYRKAGYEPESFAPCPTNQSRDVHGHSVHMMELMSDTEMREYVGPGGNRTPNCYVPSENDTNIVHWVVSDPGGIGYLGYSYYSSNSAQLTVVPVASDLAMGIVDTLDSPVEPSAESITDGSYNIFRRELFVNVDNSKWDVAFRYMDYGFSEAGQTHLNTVGYLRLNVALHAKMLQRILQRGNEAADFISIPPETCPAGTGLKSTRYNNAFGALKTNYTCEPCHAGFAKAGAKAEPCAPCAAGMYSDTAGQSRCSFCSQGKYSGVQASICEDCPPNTMAGVPGMPSCTNCSAGRAAATSGSSTCERCALGRFRADGDNGLCTACPAGKTTVFLAADSIENCGCSAGSYATAADEAVCAQCNEGLQCPFGSTEANLLGGTIPAPRLEAGYFSFSSDPLSVYKCLSDAACPGGVPDTCAAHSRNVVCGQCDAGFVRVQGVCEECADIYQSRILWPTIPLLVGPPVILGLYSISQNDVEEWGKPLTGLAAMAYVCLVNLQVLAVSSLINVKIPEGANSKLLGELVADTLQFETILRPECAFSNSASVTLLPRILMPVIVAALFAFTYAFTRFMPKLPILNVFVLINVYGGVFNTFYISIAAAALGLFQCYPHPNGKSSVLGAPKILCFESEWNGLVSIALFGLLFFCLLPFVLFAHLIRIIPRFFEKSVNFRLSIKFIARKFCPSDAWWTLVLLIKGLWVNLATVFFTQGADQILWLNVGLLAYVLATVLVMPWRHYTVNLADITSHAVLTYIFTMQAVFLETPDNLKRRISLATFIIVAANLFVLVCHAGYLAYRFLWPKPETFYVEHAHEMGETFGRASQQSDRLASLMALLPGKELRALMAAAKIIQRESNDVGVITARFSAQKDKFDSFHEEPPVFEPRTNSPSLCAEGHVYGAASPRHPSAWRSDGSTSTSNLHYIRGSILDKAHPEEEGEFWPAASQDGLSEPPAPEQRPWRPASTYLIQNPGEVIEEQLKRPASVHPSQNPGQVVEEKTKRASI